MADKTTSASFVKTMVKLHLRPSTFQFLPIWLQSWRVWQKMLMLPFWIWRHRWTSPSMRTKGETSIMFRPTLIGTLIPTLHIIRQYCPLPSIMKSSQLIKMAFEKNFRVKMRNYRKWTVCILLDFSSYSIDIQAFWGHIVEWKSTLNSA